MPAAVDERAVAVLFYFDGTLGDTETPAMRVAFWELAPYFPDATAESLTVAARDDFVRANAGKAFEFMVDVVEEDRAKAGMPPIEDVRSGASEQSDVLSVVDAARAESGLPPLAETRKLGKDLLTLQKDETVDALAVLAVPAPACRRPSRRCARQTRRFPSPPPAKPRVPVSVVACDRGVLPARGDPLGRERLRPAEVQADPSVYLLAAEDRRAPKSVRRGGGQPSGVGSASSRNRTHRRLRRRVARRAPTRRTRTL